MEVDASQYEQGWILNAVPKFEGRLRTHLHDLVWSASGPRIRETETPSAYIHLVHRPRKSLHAVFRPKKLGSNHPETLTLKYVLAENRLELRLDDGGIDVPQMYSVATTIMGGVIATNANVPFGAALMALGVGGVYLSNRTNKYASLEALAKARHLSMPVTTTYLRDFMDLRP